MVTYVTSEKRKVQKDKINLITCYPGIHYLMS